MGGVRLISSASTMFAKIGPGANYHLPASGRRVFADDVGARDVGRHQVGRELNAVELEVEHARHRMDEQRFGEARHADDEAVAADEQRQQHLLDDLVLADDELLQLLDDALAPVLHPIGKRDIVLLHVLFDLRHGILHSFSSFYAKCLTRR